MTEVAELVRQLNKAFEEFKAANDERLAELEKGRQDPLTTEKLERLEKEIAQLQDRLDRASAAAWQPPAGDGPDELAEFEATKALIAPAAPKLTREEWGEYTKAFDLYLRRDEHSLTYEQRKTLQAGSDPDGGYLLLPRQLAIIRGILLEQSPVRRYADSLTVTARTVEVPIDDANVGAGWVGELDARPETATPQLTLVSVTPGEQYAQPGATQQFLDDAGIDVAGWLARAVGEKFAQMEATAFISGDGVNKPTGVLSYPSGTGIGQIERITASSLTAPTIDDFLEVEASLKEAYRSRALWFVSRRTMGYLRKLKDSNGQYVWQPSLQQGTPSTFLGYPIHTSPDLDEIGTANGQIAILGDWRTGYLIIDRAGIRTLRDPYTAKPKVLFYTTRRVGGTVKNFEAIKVLQLPAV